MHMKGSTWSSIGQIFLHNSAAHVRHQTSWTAAGRTCVHNLQHFSFHKCTWTTAAPDQHATRCHHYAFFSGCKFSMKWCMIVLKA